MKERPVTFPSSILSPGHRVKKALASGFAVLMSLSLVLVAPAAGVRSGLNLPSTIVRIVATDDTHSYFNITLSDVPPGYDVANGTYPGWCVDITAEMARAPAIHEVRLYSSLNVQGELANERWDMVNYILNHKQGAARDIQQAIWYFVHMNGNYTPTSTVAWTIINDTLANGDGFIPKYGQTVSVICFPVILFPGSPSVQISVIELTVDPLIGDITGPGGVPDGKVNILDVALVALHFGETVPPAPSTADLNKDGKINIIDIANVATHFSDHYP